MAGSDYLLDTVIVVRYFNRDPVIRQRLAHTRVYIPSISIGELFFGAYHSQRVTENIAQIRDLVAINTILPCDVETGNWYGQIKHQLRAKGRPIPENDMWIAAIALQYGLTVVTRDAHFREIDGLQIETW